MKSHSPTPIPRSRTPGAIVDSGTRRRWWGWMRGVCWGLLPLMVACRTLPPMPAVDLAARGWAVRHGQAVWHPPGRTHELAGDLLVATHTNGNYFVQLTKNPFPLVTARVADGSWEIRFGAEGRLRRGRGEPPSRLVWFQVPPALLTGKVSDPWIWETPGLGRWRLEHPRSGETLEGGLFP